MRQRNPNPRRVVPGKIALGDGRYTLPGGADTPGDAAVAFAQPGGGPANVHQPTYRHGRMGRLRPGQYRVLPRYFCWFDGSTANHFKAAGLPKPRLIRRYNVVGWPIVDARATFHVPSRFGDEVVIETRITRFGRSSFDVEHRLLRGDVLAVEGFEKRVLVAKTADGEGMTAVPVPEDVIAMFQGGPEPRP